MTSEDFAARIAQMMQTLYRVSCTQLHQAADREDAVQECLRKAWEKRNKLADARYMQTWVIRILINECRNIQRKRKRSVPMETLDVAKYLAQTDRDEDAALRSALYTLEDSLRLPILLHYIEGYDTGEVARMLRLPQGTVKSRMARGRKQLRSILSEEVFEA